MISIIIQRLLLPREVANDSCCMAHLFSCHFSTFSGGHIDVFYKSRGSKCGLIDRSYLEGFYYKVCLLMPFFSYFCIIITITPCISSWINNRYLGVETKREVKIASLLSLLHCTFLVPVLIGRVLGGTSSQLLLLSPQHLLVSYRFFLFYWTLPRFRQYVRSVLDFPICISLCSDTWSRGSCWESFLNTLVRETDSRENLIVCQGDGRSGG